MNTPMQELLEELKHYKATFQNPIGPVIEKIEKELLKKEKALIIEAFHEGMRCQGWDPNRGIAEEYYNETFNANQENLQDSTNGYTYYPQENKTVFNTKEK
jgi:hypothetical protein